MAIQSKEPHRAPPSVGQMLLRNVAPTAQTVTCNIAVCHPLETVFDGIANDCGNEGYGQSKSGFPM